METLSKGQAAAITGTANGEEYFIDAVTHEHCCIFEVSEEAERTEITLHACVLPETQIRKMEEKLYTGLFTLQSSGQRT